MPDHPSWPAELVEKGSVALNDKWAAGSQGARWHQLEPMEQDHWREAVVVVLSALSGDLVPRDCEFYSEQSEDAKHWRPIRCDLRYGHDGRHHMRFVSGSDPLTRVMAERDEARSQADALAEALEEISGAAKTWAGLAPGVAVGWFAAIQKAADEALAALHSPVSSNDSEKSNTTTVDQWTRRCAECDAEFSSFPRDNSERCGNCAATTHLPRCEHRWPDPVGGDTFRCQRPVGHVGHHTYGRRRA